MARLREAFKAYLQADTTLVALLPGGIYNKDDFGLDFGGADEAPRQSGGVRIAAYMVLAWKESIPFGPSTVGAEQEEVEAYIYQDSGYGIIDQAIDAFKAHVHHQFVTADNRALASCRVIHVGPETTSKEVGGSPVRFIRTEITQIRK